MLKIAIKMPNKNVIILIKILFFNLYCTDQYTAKNNPRNIESTKLSCIKNKINIPDKSDLKLMLNSRVVLIRIVNIDIIAEKVTVKSEKIEWIEYSGILKLIKNIDRKSLNGKPS